MIENIDIEEIESFLYPMRYKAKHSEFSLSEILIAHQILMDDKRNKMLGEFINRHKLNNPLKIFTDDDGNHFGC